MKFQYQARVNQAAFIQKMNDVSFCKGIHPEIIDIRLIQGTSLTEKGSKYVMVWHFRGKEFLRECLVLEYVFPGKSIILMSDDLSDTTIESMNHWEGDLLTSTIEYECRLKKISHRIFEPFVANNVKSATLTRLQKMADDLSSEKSTPVKTLNAQVWRMPIKFATALLIFLFFLLINFAAAEQWEAFYSPDSEVGDC